MSIVADIIAFLKILPQILDIMGRIGNLIKAHNLQQWIDELETQIDSLEKAKTPDEKLAVARSLADLIHGL